VAFYHLNAKGQVSIEYILILVIMLIYIQIMVQPILETAVESSEEISQLGQVKAATEKLSNAVDFISLSSGNSKQTVGFYLPAHTAINCLGSSKEFRFSADIKVTHEACQNDRDADDLLCTKRIPVVGSSNLSCVGFGNGVRIAAQDVGRYYDVSVRKVGDTVYVETL
jgi:uncharacterized protein (UPF0333 family)